MDRYDVVEQLGVGVHGEVWKTVDKVTGEGRAIKIFHESISKYEDCLNVAEVNCLLELGSHPNILCLHDIIVEGTTLSLVFDLMDCDLFKLMKRRRGHPFSEDEVRNFCFQILKGLTHMHSKGYCHRDLKPENLLVRGSDTVKIADFGLAINMLHQSNEWLESYVVTRPYRAPELLLGSTRYDFAIDNWAMGVIVAELLTGYSLFTGSNTVNQMRSICSVIGSPDSVTWPQGLALAGSVHWSFPEEFKNVDSIKQLSSLLPSASAEAIDLINGFLSWDPKRRLGAREALQHAFFYPCYNHSKALAYNGEQTSEHVSESIDKSFPRTGTSKINPMVQRVRIDQQRIPFDQGAYQVPASVSVSIANMSQVPRMGSTPLHASDYDNQEDANSLSVRQFGSSSEYSIRQNSSYMGSYQITESLTFENLPSYPFPCMGPKQFNRKMPCTDDNLPSYPFPCMGPKQFNRKMPCDDNLPSYPFPCMGPKQFNRKMPCDDKRNDPQGFGD